MLVAFLRSTRGRGGVRVRSNTPPTSSHRWCRCRHEGNPRHGVEPLVRDFLAVPCGRQEAGEGFPLTVCAGAGGWNSGSRSHTACVCRALVTYPWIDSSNGGVSFSTCPGPGLDRS